MLRKNSIFTKLVALIILATLTVGTVLTWTSSYIAEYILLNQMKKSSEHNMKLIESELLSYNEQFVNMMAVIQSSSEFKQYLTNSFSNPITHLNIVINLGKFIERNNDTFHNNGTHFIVSGIDNQKNRQYYSGDLKWNSLSEDVINQYMVIDSNLENRILYFSSSDLFKNSIDYDHYIFATKPMFDTYSGQIYGYSIILMDEERWYNRYSAYLTEGVTISLITNNGLVLTSSNRSLINKTVEEDIRSNLHNERSDSYTIIDEKDTTYIFKYLPAFNAYLMQEIDQTVAFSSLDIIFTLTLSAVIIVSLCLIVCIYFIAKRITDPLYQLVNTMQRSGVDAWMRHPLQQSNSYEINILTKNYNDLIKQIENYTQQVVYEQTERRKADYSALQMQINPHFLYNTLTSIKYLAKLNRVDDVDQTITSLSTILQNSIGSTEDQITVRQEIETLQHYVHINKIRYGDQIQVHIRVDDDCLDYIVPKLIIQPFVENSFFHAFPGNRKGNIYIYIREKQNNLLIEIMDDGIGKQSENLKKTKRSVSGIGIKNVRHRIQLLYGKKFGVDVEATDGFGTVVKLLLPLQVKNEQ